MMRWAVFGLLFYLDLVIRASSVEPEPSCERQAAEAMRPAVEAMLLTGRSYAAARYIGDDGAREAATERQQRDIAKLLHCQMNEIERECLRRKLKP